MSRTAATIRSLQAGVILAVTISVLPRAHAENKDRAREAYRQANQHYDLGEFQQALDGFKEAYRNYEEPAFLFNIAQCHRALGNKADAVIFYRSYLRKSPEAPNREYVQRTIAELESAIAQERPAPKPPERSPTPTTTAPEPAPAPVPAPVATKPAQTSPPLATTPTPPRVDKPVYRRWWLWTAIAGVAVVGAGVGITLALAHPSDPHPSLGSLRF